MRLTFEKFKKYLNDIEENLFNCKTPKCGNQIYSRTIEVRQLENRRSLPLYGRNIQKQGGKIP